MRESVAFDGVRGMRKKTLASAIFGTRAVHAEPCCGQAYVQPPLYRIKIRQQCESLIFRGVAWVCSLSLHFAVDDAGASICLSSIARGTPGAWCS
jgi:hypothetical protein